MQITIALRDDHPCFLEQPEWQDIILSPPSDTIITDEWVESYKVLPLMCLLPRLIHGCRSIVNDKVSQTAARPTREEVRKYYNDNPALFKERRVYQFQEILAEVPQDQVAAVSERMRSAKTPAAIAEVLKTSNVRFVSNQASLLWQRWKLAYLAEGWIVIEGFL